MTKLSNMKSWNLLATFMFALCCFSSAQAQESTNASGGDASGSGGTVAYSVGQVVYTTNTGSAASVAQGVQQTYVISHIGLNETAMGITLTAFPNPTVGNLTLQISNYNNEKLVYQLFDVQGKLVSNGQIESPQTFIGMSSLASATYFIHVVNEKNEEIQSFKIVKQ
jgi:opacity protein-like surface antigen